MKRKEEEERGRGETWKGGWREMGGEERDSKGWEEGKRERGEKQEENEGVIWGFSGKEEVRNERRGKEEMEEEITARN